MELAHGVQKVITATDLKWPVNPDGDIPIRVFDNQTHRVYEFMIAGGHGEYLKPIFQSRGWKAFVKDRGIAVGDEIGLWLEENPTYQTQYRIVLFKPHLFPGHPDLHVVKKSNELAHGVQKVITAADLTRLTVTTKMFAVLPPVTPGNAISIKVFDNQTHRVYEFMLAGRHGEYLKPVFQSRGWKAFVKDRGIAVGDQIGLWLEENPTYQTQYRIVLFK